MPSASLHDESRVESHRGVVKESAVGNFPKLFQDDNSDWKYEQETPYGDSYRYDQRETEGAIQEQMGEASPYPAEPGPLKRYNFSKKTMTHFNL